LTDVWVLLPFFLLGALLYTSVGHGGATIYLAILVLAGFATKPLQTTVLVLNIVAAGLGFVQFQHAGHLRPKLLLAFVVTSIPAAYLGGAFPLSDRATKILLFIALGVAAARFLAFAHVEPRKRRVEGPAFYAIAAVVGAVLGFFAGATGIGGGIYLSPILVMLGWATVKEAASVAGAFIVLNSAAGLAAKLPDQPLHADILGPTILVVVVGAAIGGHLGARRIPPRGLQLLLGAVLLVATLKLALDLGLVGRLKALI